MGSDGGSDQSLNSAEREAGDSASGESAETELRDLLTQARIQGSEASEPNGVAASGAVSDDSSARANPTRSLADVIQEHHEAMIGGSDGASHVSDVSDHPSGDLPAPSTSAPPPAPAGQPVDSHVADVGGAAPIADSASATISDQHTGFAEPAVVDIPEIVIPNQA